MTRRMDWYFGAISPSAWLAFHRSAKLPAGVEIRDRPVLFAGLLEASGQLGPGEIPGKKRQTAMNVAWRARALGPPLAQPDRRIGDPAVKAVLRANTEEADALGIFGVPTAREEGQLFWGEDAHDMLAVHLSGDTFLSDPALIDMFALEPATEGRGPAAPAIHHANPPAPDMGGSGPFYRDIIGLALAPGTFPPTDQMGHVSGDPDRLTLLPCPAHPQPRAPMQGSISSARGQSSPEGAGPPPVAPSAGTSRTRYRTATRPCHGSTRRASPTPWHLPSRSRVCRLSTSVTPR